MRGHAFVVERAARQAAAHVGDIADLHVRREDLLAEAVEQERRLAVQTAAADRTHEVTEQPGRHGRLEQHGNFHGLQLARTQPAHAALARPAPHRLHRLEVLGGARDGVPVVALHLVALAGDHRAGEAVARARIAAAEAQGVGVDEVRLLRRDAGAFRVGDARVHRERRRLARARPLDRLLHRQIPWMVQIEIGQIARQQVGIGQPGAVVGGREARDRERRLHRVPHRLRREVRGAGMTALLAEVDGDAHALVAVVLDGLHLTSAHGDVLAEALADFGLGGAGPEAAGVVEDVGCDLAQLVDAVGEGAGGHGCGSWRGLSGSGARPSRAAPSAMIPA